MPCVKVVTITEEKSEHKTMGETVAVLLQNRGTGKTSRNIQRYTMNKHSLSNSGTFFR
jgi:hypothetical protein